MIISPDKEIIGLNIFSGENNLLLKESEIKDELLKKNIFVKNIKINKQYPDKIILDIVFRSPYAYVVANSQEIFIDNEGFPSKSYHDTRPSVRISVPSIIYSPASPDWRLVKAVKLVGLLNNYGLQFNSIVINDNSSEISGLIDDIIEIIIPLTKDAHQVSASLQTIISRFRIEGKFVAKIDLRYDKPVVVLKNE